jgi:hypothetical protein
VKRLFVVLLAVTLVTGFCVAPFTQESVQVSANDSTPPTLNNIIWTDINLNSVIDAGDQLIFSWSESMNASTVTAANVNSCLDSTASGVLDYDGAGLQVEWNSPTNTQTTITLGANEAITGGERVNPAATVTDAAGNPDGTAGAGAQIPFLAGTPPTIMRNPATLAFTATVNGTDPANQSVSISNSGQQTLNWSVSKTQTWLSIIPVSGTNTGTVTCSVNISEIVIGTYNDTITITGAGATNTPQTVAVTLSVSVVTFPDPGLEAAIRDAIGKPSGDIYQTDLDGLTVLNA